MDKAKDALGHGQITNLTAAVAVSTGYAGGIPAGTETVILQCTGQAVRYRDDGVAPTSTTGLALQVGVMYEFTIAQIARMQVIESAATAVLNIASYGTKV